MSLQSKDSESPLREEKKTGFTFRGKEIVLSKTRGRPMSRGIEKRKGWYPDEKRIEVVSLYACIGNPDDIASLTGVPVATIRGWRREGWFIDLLSEIKDENNEVLDAKFTEIVQRTQDLIQDRLENGDYVVLKDGTQVRKPVSIRDLALVGAITVDKRQIIRKQPTSIQEQQVTPVVSRLEQLAETFKSLANKKELPSNQTVVDVDYEEVIDAEKVRERTETAGKATGTEG